MVDFLSSRASILLLFGLFAFVTLSVFGLGHMSGMIKNENGDMAGCIFTGQTMLCKMSIVEHISLWQSMLTAMPQRGLMLLVLLVLLIAAIFITKNILAPPRFSKSEALTERLYLKEHPDLLLFDPLKEAISAGILNPKIYEFAIL